MISVVIRSRNECRNLDYCLGKLAQQDIENEVIIVDSHSEDDTRKIAKIHNCKIIQCEDFTYGKALNEGIKASKGEYIGIMSGHCFPTKKNFLRVLQENLKIKKIAGAYARQVPHKDTNPLEFRNFIYTYRLEPAIQKKCPFFNNAASMVRRDIWDDVKFDEEVKAQEDIIWAIEVQKLGYAIAYEPEAIVEHLHEEDTNETVQRYIKEYHVLKEVWK
jgi:glycosyltransferase involved in cell wall biosynthesis